MISKLSAFLEAYTTISMDQVEALVASVGAGRPITLPQVSETLKSRPGNVHLNAVAMRAEVEQSLRAAGLVERPVHAVDVLPKPKQPKPKQPEPEPEPPEPGSMADGWRASAIRSLPDASWNPPEFVEALACNPKISVEDARILFALSPRPERARIPTIAERAEGMAEIGATFSAPFPTKSERISAGWKAAFAKATPG